MGVSLSYMPTSWTPNKYKLRTILSDQLLETNIYLMYFIHPNKIIIIYSKQFPSWKEICTFIYFEKENIKNSFLRGYLEIYRDVVHQSIQFEVSWIWDWILGVLNRVLYMLDVALKYAQCGESFKLMLISYWHKLKENHNWIRIY